MTNNQQPTTNNQQSTTNNQQPTTSRFASLRILASALLAIAQRRNFD
jgi:hypothetical protein